MGRLSPSTNSTAPVGGSIGPSTAKSASRSKPFTGTSRNSEPSGNTTRTVAYGQTTCAFVTTYPPSINTPLPLLATVLMNTIDGETDSKICAEVSGAGVGVAVGSGVGIAVGSGVGVSVGSGVGVSVGGGFSVAVGSGVDVAVGSGVGVSVGSGVAVGSGVDVAVGSGVGVSVGSGVSVGVSVAVAVAVGEFVGVGVGVAVGSGVDVSVGSGVAVSVGSGVAVSVGSCVGVAVGSDVAVGSGVGVFCCTTSQAVSTARAARQASPIGTSLGNNLRGSMMRPVVDATQPPLSKHCSKTGCSFSISRPFTRDWCRLAI